MAARKTGGKAGPVKASRKPMSDAMALRALHKDPRIDIIDDERSIGNSLIINLKDGWRFRAPDEHVFGEDTAVEALASMKEVHECDCSDACKAAALAWKEKAASAVFKARKGRAGP